MVVWRLLIDESVGELIFKKEAAQKGMTLEHWELG